MASHAVVKDASINPPSLYFGAYQELDLVCVLAGAVTGNVPVKLTKNGRLITLTFNNWAITSTSAATISSNAFIPAGLITPLSTEQIVRCTYAGVQGTARLSIQSGTGDILITAAAVNATYGVQYGGNFPTATALSIPSISITYSL